MYCTDRRQQKLRSGMLLSETRLHNLCNSIKHIVVNVNLFMLLRAQKSLVCKHPNRPERQIPGYWEQSRPRCRHFPSLGWEMTTARSADRPGRPGPCLRKGSHAARLSFFCLFFRFMTVILSWTRVRGPQSSVHHKWRFYSKWKWETYVARIQFFMEVLVVVSFEANTPPEGSYSPSSLPNQKRPTGWSLSTSK